MCQHWLKSFASKQQKCFYDDLALPSKQFHLPYSESVKFIATSWCWLLMGFLDPFSDLYMTEEYI